MQTLNVPAVDFFLNDFDIVEPLPFRLTWEEAKDNPFCILHTSGSTGIPKPVFVTYATFACNDAHQSIPSLGGNPTLINFLKGNRLFLDYHFSMPLVLRSVLNLTFSRDSHASYRPPSHCLQD